VTTKYIATAVSAVCGTGAAIAGMTSGAPAGRNGAPGLPATGAWFASKEFQPASPPAVVGGALPPRFTVTNIAGCTAI
jgi:hypothetical protein